jgi:hypothetical protein
VAVRDYRDNIEPTLRPALGSDEVLVAASPLVQDPGATEDVSVAEELANLVNPALYLGGAGWSGNLIQRVAFGRALVGGPDSIAGRLLAALDAVGRTSTTIAVTDAGIVILTIELRPRRQGWLKRLLGPVHQVATVVHRIDRCQVAGAVHDPRGVLRRGRLQVAFVDGSVGALCCQPSLAPQVVAAMVPPG